MDSLRRNGRTGWADGFGADSMAMPASNRMGASAATASLFDPDSRAEPDGEGADAEAGVGGCGLTEVGLAGAGSGTEDCAGGASGAGGGWDAPRDGRNESGST
jgi:hypothetical protein